uniref:Neurotransmitter-gated ion-channel transmembrane domain-containing protein n=1 Tax=Acrobeloides nanus TaxID=290746 RepID=A0A914CH19_9BILA
MGIDISEYVENVEWDLLSVVGTRNERRYPCCDYPVVDITYSLNIRRKKLFYTINLMIPCIGIATLTSFVFYLPSESHNKIQLCISVLVSLTIFILLLVEIVPPTSLVTPLIGKYLLFTMILVNLSTVLSVIVENVHYRRDQPMAKWVRSIFIHFLGKYILIFRRPGNPKFHRQARYKRIPTLNALRLLDDHFKKDLSLKESKISANKKLCRSYTDGIYNEIMNHQITQNYTNDVPIEFKHRASLIGINIRYIERTLKKIRQQEELQADWRFVAMVIDRIMLILFTVTIIGGTLLATTSAPSLRDQRVPL